MYSTTAANAMTIITRFMCVTPLCLLSFVLFVLFDGGCRGCRRTAGNGAALAFCSNLGRSFLLGSGSCEHVHHAVVSFIAGVLKYGPVGLSGRHFCFPRLGPRVRVVNCEFVLNRFLAGASQALGHLYILA